MIEPITELARAIAKKRPRDRVVNCLIATENEEVGNTKFFEFSPSELSTANEARAELLIQDGYRLVREYAVTSRAIAEFAKTVRPADPFLFTIDIEGLDYAVLKSIDWAIFQPRVICVENPHWQSEQDKIGTMLKSEGYELVSSHFVSAIYINHNY